MRKGFQFVKMGFVVDFIRRNLVVVDNNCYLCFGVIAVYKCLESFLYNFVNGFDVYLNIVLRFEVLCKSIQMRVQFKDRVSLKSSHCCITPLLSISPPSVSDINWAGVRPSAFFTEKWWFLSCEITEIHDLDGLRLI